MVLGVANYAGKECFASNPFFAAKTNSTIREVQRAIEQLKQCPFVKVWYSHSGKQRHIKILDYELNQVVNPVDNLGDHVKADVVPRQDRRSDHVKADVDMNTDYDHSDNIKKEREGQASPSLSISKPKLILAQTSQKSSELPKSEECNPTPEPRTLEKAPKGGVRSTKGVYPTRLVLPPHLETVEGRKSADEWCEYRRATGDPVSEYGWAKNVKQFETVEQLIGCVDMAISRDWRGLDLDWYHQALEKKKPRAGSSTQNGYRNMTTAEKGVEEARRQMEKEGILKPRERAVN
jgi:hypothetical protein